jgi:hypothetical protein
MSDGERLKVCEMFDECRLAALERVEVNAIARAAIQDALAQGTGRVVHALVNRLESRDPLVIKVREYRSSALDPAAKLTQSVGIGLQDIVSRGFPKDPVP